jgi:hypothetical protein
MCQVYFIKEKINLFFLVRPLNIQWFLCYNFINVYFIKFSNEKVGLNTILTNLFQIYLFLTFVISKFSKFCNWFTINPIEGWIVSKWNLGKIWIYFLVFSWKITFFYIDIFLTTFSIYFTMLSPNGTKKNLLSFFLNIQKWFVKV